MSDDKKQKKRKGNAQPLPVTKEMFVEALVNTAQINEAKEKQKGFLCMFSGGLDSTAMLHSLLTNKEYEHFDVYIHHMRIINRENRADVETNAARRIVKYYHSRPDIREFDYKESTLDMSAMDSNWSPRFSFDIDAVCWMAAQICIAKPNIKYAAMAVTKDDMDTPQDDTTIQRVTQAPKIFDAALYMFPKPWPRPQFIYPTQSLTKEQLWKTMPPNVQKMTWSCRTPVWKKEVAHRCGRCHTCIKRKEYGIDS